MTRPGAQHSSWGRGARRSPRPGSLTFRCSLLDPPLHRELAGTVGGHGQSGKHVPIRQPLTEKCVPAHPSPWVPPVAIINEGQALVTQLGGNRGGGTDASRSQT